MDFVIILLFVIGGAVIVALIRRRFRRPLRADALGQTGPHSAKLGELLAADCPPGETENTENASTAIKRALTNLSSVECYCAMMSMKSTEDGRPLATWRFDVVLPDRRHARQAVHIENWLDEWITIGKKNYR